MTCLSIVRISSTKFYTILVALLDHTFVKRVVTNRIAFVTDEKSYKCECPVHNDKNHIRNRQSSSLTIFS